MAETKKFSARPLVESALMIALATVLSVLKVLDLPYGGSITLACMFPIVLLSYRYGVGLGLLSGVIFGAIQQLLGLSTLSYVTTWQSILAVIFLDYIVAFAVAGLGGMFRKVIKNQAMALTLGTLIICILRYLCHVISGCTVWAGLSIPTEAALIYSLIYNATYMIPEALVTMLIAFYIGSTIDFRNPKLSILKPGDRYKISFEVPLAGLVLSGALIADIVLIFQALQDPETGAFVNNLSGINWLVIFIVTASAFLVADILILESLIRNKEHNKKAKRENNNTIRNNKIP